MGKARIERDLDESAEHSAQNKVFAPEKSRKKLVRFFAARLAETRLNRESR